jgi:hypothetical protein
LSALGGLFPIITTYGGNEIESVRVLDSEAGAPDVWSHIDHQLVTCQTDLYNVALSLRGLTLLLMPSPQVSASRLSSVVRFPSMEQWEAIDNDESPALFHAKFLGKSMANEEEEWSSSQPPIADIGSELEGKELDGERPIGKAVDGKTDGDRTDLDSDDIIAGCYMLDIGIDDFPFPKIWVRADYIRIFNYLQAYYDWPRAHNVAPAVVITGQPGIGKVLRIHRFLD